MKFNSERALTSGIAVVIVIITAILFLSLFQSRRIDETSQQVSNSQQVRLHALRLHSAILHYESNTRGYVLSGRNDFLETLPGFNDDIRKEIGILREYTPGFQSNLIDSLADLIEKKLRIQKNQWTLQQMGDSAGARALITSGIGKVYMDSISNVISSMEANENAILTDLQAKQTRAARLLNTVLLSTLIIALILIYFFGRKVRIDIARQKQEEKKFSALLDSSPDAVVIVNEKGIIQRTSGHTGKVFGYTKEEMLGKPLSLLLPLDIVKLIEKHTEDESLHPGLATMDRGVEVEAKTKSGNIFPAEVNFSPLKTAEGLLVTASIRDITARKKSEEKFRSLLDSAPDATVIVNDRGIIQLTNNQAVQLFGYNKEEMTGQPVEILIPADVRSRHENHRSNFMKSARVRSMGEGIELNAIKKGGISFPVEISLSPIQTEEGMLVAASVRDITVRKKLENELKKSNAELESFTYSVSHDLRAPLRGIIGFTAILEEDYTSKLDEEAKRITGIIKKNTLKMGNLIDDLLNFSRIGRYELIKTKINTGSLVKELINEVDPNGKVEWQVEKLPEMYADINMIRQVWINFLSNAVKYSSTKEKPVIRVYFTKTPNENIYSVADNGVGFDNKYNHKLFKVFQRLHGADQFEGSGVGLAIIDRIVSRHNGRVWGEGRAGEGATFSFSLPNHQP